MLTNRKKSRPRPRKKLAPAVTPTKVATLSTQPRSTARRSPATPTDSQSSANDSSSLRRRTNSRTTMNCNTDSARKNTSIRDKVTEPPLRSRPPKAVQREHECQPEEVEGALEASGRGPATLTLVHVNRLLNDGESLGISQDQ